MVKFISYDGKFPSLCCGTLILEIDGEKVKFPKFCMQSGGYAGCDENSEEYIEYGEWSVKVPKEYEQYKQEIEAVVNKNVEKGCCGGCI